MANDMINHRNNMFDSMNDWFDFPRNFSMIVKFLTSCNPMLVKMIRIIL